MLLSRMAHLGFKSYLNGIFPNLFLIIIKLKNIEEILSWFYEDGKHSPPLNWLLKYLDLPGDLLNSTVIESSLVLPLPPPPPPSILPPKVLTSTKHHLSKYHNQELITSAVDLLKKSKSPLIVVGKGAAYSRAEHQVLDLYWPWWKLRWWFDDDDDLMMMMTWWWRLAGALSD